jgi:HEAT repeat protein
MNAKTSLAKIIDLDSQILDLRDQFEEFPEKEKKDALENFCTGQLKNTGVLDELPLSLVRATDMICSLEDGAVILSKGLFHPNQEIRHLFGEALITMGDEGVEAIVPAVDSVLKQGGIAAKEMPYILTYLDDPAITEQIIRFLDNENPDVVSSAIEALAEISDPDAILHLKKLLDDNREIDVDDEEEKGEIVTIGMLAKEAIGIIDSSKE